MMDNYDLIVIGLSILVGVVYFGLTALVIWVVYRLTRRGK